MLRARGARLCETASRRARPKELARRIVTRKGEDAARGFGRGSWPRVEPGPQGLAKIHRLNRFVSLNSCAIFPNPILQIREGEDMKKAFFMMVLTIALGTPPALAANSEATRSVTIYHSPEMNLEEVDRQLLDQVGNGSTINFAAFILSDYKIMDSLRGAADRGARIRIYLDPKEIWTQRFTEKHPFVKLWRTRGVDIDRGGMSRRQAAGVTSVRRRGRWAKRVETRESVRWKMGGDRRSRASRRTRFIRAQSRSSRTDDMDCARR